NYASTSSGTISLGVMCTIAPVNLISLINHMNTRVPDLRIELREGAGRDVLGHLLEGSIDVALLGLPDYPKEVSTTPLFEERFVVSLPPGHRLEGQETVTFRDLDGERYLRRTKCEYLEYHADIARKLGIKLDVRMESDHESWVQSMVVAGLGLAILPESLALHAELARAR
ncbi:MAG: LysR family transcriptional regulator substrate-binding protein, partial [Pseudomonadota bacterium]